MQPLTVNGCYDMVWLLVPPTDLQTKRFGLPAHNPSPAPSDRSKTLTITPGAKHLHNQIYEDLLPNSGAYNTGMDYGLHIFVHWFLTETLSHWIGVSFPALNCKPSRCFLFYSCSCNSTGIYKARMNATVLAGRSQSWSKSQTANSLSNQSNETFRSP